MFVCLFLFGAWGMAGEGLVSLKENFHVFSFTLKVANFFCQHTFIIVTIHKIWCNYYLPGKLEPET